jgi:hypothetical protein
MNNLRATGRYVQTAFLQAGGELCLKARPQRKNAVARPTRSELQSAGQDSQPISRHPMPAHSIRNAPARTLRRSMRIDHGSTADRILDVTILRPLTWRNNESGPLAWWFSLGRIVRKLDRVAKGRPRKRILRVPRHSGSIHFPIEYIKLNQSHAVVCRHKTRAPRKVPRR